MLKKKEQNSSSSSADPEKIKVTINHIIFHAPDTGYTVASVTDTEKNISFTAFGNLASLQPGENGEFSGAWVTSKKYGRQFKVSEFREVRPSTVLGIEKYLSSGMVKGIGPKIARLLVSRFGTDTLDIIEHEPDRLKEIEGIGKKRIDMICAAWRSQRAVRDVMIFLQGHGIGPARAVKIYKFYGDRTIEIIKNNPYKLAEEIWGIGFKIADEFARKMGFPDDSPRRAEAALLHTLAEASEEGHCYLCIDDMKKECIEKLSIPLNPINEALDTLLEDGRLVKQDSAVYLSRFNQYEDRIVQALVNIVKTPFSYPILHDVDELMQFVSKDPEFEPSPGQLNALQMAFSKKVSIITGGPGVGKTTILRAFVRSLLAVGRSVALCAPTGRAAHRMTESIGIEAKTIHRMLEFKPKSGTFTYGYDRQLEYDYIIVDEMSMVDTPLFSSLLAAIHPTSCLVMVGDVDQLPSVGPGQVLRDLIESGTLPVTRLTEVHRQKEGSFIIRNAHRINQGGFPTAPPASRAGEPLHDFYFIQCETPDEIKNYLFKMVLERIPRRFKLNPVTDVQVLSPMLRGEIGVDTLNRELQDVLNPHAPSLQNYRVGDKVMQIRNNYDKEVFNGDIGRVCGIDPKEETLRVDFGDKVVDYAPAEFEELKMAYACTIHKSQGSEFPAVIIPVHTTHYIMLQRNLLYTALTRAQKLAILIGSKKALAIAVRNDTVNHRNTGLREKLKSALSQTP